VQPPPEAAIEEPTMEDVFVLLTQKEDGRALV